MIWCRENHHHFHLLPSSCHVHHPKWVEFYDDSSFLISIWMTNLTILCFYRFAWFFMSTSEWMRRAHEKHQWNESSQMTWMRIVVSSQNTLHWHNNHKNLLTHTNLGSNSEFCLSVVFFLSPSFHSFTPDTPSKRFSFLSFPLFDWDHTIQIQNYKTRLFFIFIL